MLFICGICERSLVCSLVCSFRIFIFLWKKRLIGRAHTMIQDFLKKKNDSYAIWHYKFQSYRTIFTYKPKKAINEMLAPVLIAVGENDQLVTSEYCRKVYSHLTCKKEFCQMPNAEHQLLVDFTDRFIPVVVNWFGKTLNKVKY